MGFLKKQKVWGDRGKASETMLEPASTKDIIRRCYLLGCIGRAARLAGWAEHVVAAHVQALSAEQDRRLCSSLELHCRTAQLCWA